MEKLLDLYLAGEFGKEMLTERKVRLEDVIAKLEKERAALVATLEAQTLTEQATLAFEEFDLHHLLDVTAWSYSPEHQRKIVDKLDVQAVLAVEEGEQVVYLSCRLGEVVLQARPVEPEDLRIVRDTSESDVQQSLSNLS